MIISLILVSIAAIFKAAMDTLQFHYALSFFSLLNPEFWNPELSWRNKYEGGMPGFGERFFGSTTIFVFLTDGWHLMQSVFLFSLFGAIVFYQNHFNWFIDFLILSVVFRLVFQVVYWCLRR